MAQFKPFPCEIVLGNSCKSTHKGRGRKEKRGKRGKKGEVRMSSAHHTRARGVRGKKSMVIRKRKRKKGGGEKEGKGGRKGGKKGGKKGEEKGGIVLIFSKNFRGQAPVPPLQMYWGDTPQTPLVRIPNEGPLFGLEGS